MKNGPNLRGVLAGLIAIALVFSAPGVQPYRLLANPGAAGKVPRGLAKPGLGSGSAAGNALNAVSPINPLNTGSLQNLSLNSSLVPTSGVPLTHLGAAEAEAAPSALAAPNAALPVIKPSARGEVRAAAVEKITPKLRAASKAVASIQRHDSIKQISSKKSVGQALFNLFHGKQDFNSPSFIEDPSTNDSAPRGVRPSDLRASTNIRRTGKKVPAVEFLDPAGIRAASIPADAVRKYQALQRQLAIFAAAATQPVQDSAGLNASLSGRPSMTGSTRSLELYASATQRLEALEARYPELKPRPIRIFGAGLLRGLSSIVSDISSWWASPTGGNPAMRVHQSGTKASLPAGLGWLEKVASQESLLKVFKSEAEAAELAKLKKNLEIIRYPAYKTITISDPVDPDRPTVAILAPPSVHKLAVIREGGRQAAGDVHLVMDPSWLIQESLPDGRTKLYLKKGMFLDSDGQPWIAEYTHPRPVRYFANFFTAGANERSDGDVFEHNLDVPMSSSLQLEKTTNDKLLTRLYMAAKGVGVPATLAFLMAAHPLQNQIEAKAGATDRVQIASSRLASGRVDRTAVKASIERFLAANAKTLGDEIVVKPSGPNFHSSKGVEFFNLSEAGVADRITDHVIALSGDKDMTEDGAVLIDQRLTPPALYFHSAWMGDRSAASGHDSWGTRMNRDISLDFLTREQIASEDVARSKKDYNLGLYAARTPWGPAVHSGIMVRAGKWGIPTTGEPSGPNGERSAEDAAAIIRFADTMKMLREQHGLLVSEEEARAFHEQLKEIAPKALEAIWEFERNRPRAEGEPYQAQTDFVRLDVMLHYQNGKLTPMVIEVNDHDVGGPHLIDEFYPENPGTLSREWIATMLQRARRDALKDKKILVVGSGYAGKRFIFERAKELGVKITLIDKLSPAESWAAGLVDEYIQIDTLDKNRDRAASEIRGQLERRGLLGEFDGITSFWEDDVPLTAKTAEKLGLPFIGYRESVIGRSKAAVRALMEKAGLDSPPYGVVRNEAELEAVLDKVGTPAVLKPVNGAEAKLVIEVHTKEQARAAYADIREKNDSLAEWDGAFTKNAAILVEKFLEGQEVDADFVRQSGRTVYESVTDNWPTRRPYFLAAGSSLPSHLPKDAQRAVLDFNDQVADLLGLTDGVYHFEYKVENIGTKENPEWAVHMIEPNLRMGGSYIRDWNLAVRGVDLAEEIFMTAAGVPGPVFTSPEPLTFLEGEFIIPERSGTLQYLGVEDAANTPGLRSLRVMVQPGEEIEVPPLGNQRAGMLVVEGRSRSEAVRNMAGAREKLRVAVHGSETAGRDVPAKLESLIEKRTVVSPRGMKFAKLRPGEYTPEAEAKAREMGIDILVIRNPTTEDLDARTEADGWYVQPRWVRWVRKAQPLEEYLAGLSKSRRKRFRRLLKDNEGNMPEIVPLTLKDYQEWYKLYSKHIGDIGGRLHLDPDMNKLNEVVEKGQVDRWYSMLHRHPETGEIVGGRILGARAEMNAISMGFAAWSEYAKQNSHSTLGFLKILDEMPKLGFPYLSAGADTNFFGLDYSLGLLEIKGAFGMIPHPEETFNLIKVLDSEKFRVGKGRADKERGGFFFYSLKREGPFWDRYRAVAGKKFEDGLSLGLLNGFFNEDSIPPETTMVGNDYYFREENNAVPHGVETVHHKIGPE